MLYIKSRYALATLLLGVVFFQNGSALAEKPLQEIAKKAIQDLVQDNNEFINSKTPDHFKKFADGQSPAVTMVMCSDSRVQTHNVSGDSESNVFLARNIGNQYATTKGSIAYGVDVLKTPLLIFIGHSHCGAVMAAMKDIRSIPTAIRAELATLDLHDVKNEKEGVIVNVNNQVSEALHAFQDKVAAKDLAIIGAIYDFRNDYGHGKGQLILVNINGSTDPKEIEDSHYVEGIKGVSIGAKISPDKLIKKKAPQKR